jgi:COMPASS component SWD1
MQTLRFDAPVLNAQFHPKNSRIVLATTSGGLVLVDLRKAGGKWVLVPQVEDEDERDGMEVDQEEGGRSTKKA